MPGTPNTHSPTQLKLDQIQHITLKNDRMGQIDEWPNMMCTKLPNIAGTNTYVSANV
jgi:hypothetical protein